MTVTTAELPTAGDGSWLRRCSVLLSSVLRGVRSSSHELIRRSSSCTRSGRLFLRSSVHPCTCCRSSCRRLQVTTGGSFERLLCHRITAVGAFTLVARKRARRKGGDVMHGRGSPLCQPVVHCCFSGDIRCSCCRTPLTAVPIHRRCLDCCLQQYRSVYLHVTTGSRNNARMLAVQPVYRVPGRCRSENKPKE